MKYARIKPDALVGLDMRVFTWPKVPCPAREITSEMEKDTLGPKEMFCLTGFFDRVFAVSPNTKSRVCLRANGFGMFAEQALDLYGNGSIYANAADIIETTESEYLESEAKITAHIKSLKLDVINIVAETGHLQQLIEMVVVENREVRCRRTQIQNERYQYAFVILKPSLEMFEDDNCDGGGYRSWSPGMGDLLACDWYEIVDVDYNKKD